MTVGIGETYLPAFVLALSGSQLACGLVSTLPLLAGAVLQLVSPWVVQRLGAYRRWVVCCAAIQACVFLPLLIAALLGTIAVPLVFMLAAIYWGAGMASGSAWNAWMETLVPERLRVRYFARRSRISQWGLLAGFVAGGLMLQVAAGGRFQIRAFAFLFLAAAVARFLSASFLFSQHEPLPPGKRLHSPPLGKLIASLAHDTNGPLLVYLLAAQAGVQIAGPYFTPFMLGHLGLNYFHYVTAIRRLAGQGPFPAPAGPRCRTHWRVAGILARQHRHHSPARLVAGGRLLHRADRGSGACRRNLGGLRAGHPAFVLRDHTGRKAGGRADGLQSGQCGGHRARLNHRRRALALLCRKPCGLPGVVRPFRPGECRRTVASGPCAACSGKRTTPPLSRRETTAGAVPGG